MSKFEYYTLQTTLCLLQGQTKERAFLGNMDKQLKDNAGIILPEPVSRKQRVVGGPLQETFKNTKCISFHDGSFTALMIYTEGYVINPNIKDLECNYLFKSAII